MESLELRTLLSVSATGISISTTEGALFNGAVASGTATDNGPLTAMVEWGDGTSSTADVSGSSTFTVLGSHTYADEGTDAVSVIITDAADNSTATATSTATVAEADTLAAASAATVSATEGTTFTGTVATFIDNGYPTNSPSDFTASVDWGDGSTITSGTVTSIGNGTLTVSGSHLYGDEGSHPLTVTLADDAPSTVSATASGTATVVEGDTLAAAGPATLSATEGTTFTGTVATFTDNGYPTNSPSDFTASIDWGDGTMTAGNVTGTGNGTLTVSGTHLYTDEGTDSLMVALVDDLPGTATAAAAGTATVAEGDTLTAVGDVAVNATEGISFTGPLATFTNSGYVNNPPSDFTATILWGDGTSSVVTASGSFGTFTVDGTHIYADEGSYPIMITLIDDPPGTAAATATGTATVAEADNLAAAGPATVSAIEGTTFNGTVATFSDTGYPGNVPGDFTATIDWGDGTVTSGSVTGTGNGTLTVAGSHLYADEGSDPLTVTLADDPPGTATATATGTATVSEGDTLAAAGAATFTATEGATFTGTVATFTDTGYPGNLPADFTASIDWGDGSTVTSGNITGTGNGTLTVSGSHLYADEGSNPLTVTLVDDAPGTATATVTGTATVGEGDTLTAEPTALTISAAEGTTASLTATFTNSSANPSPATDYTAMIVWGDGATSTGSAVTVTGTSTLTVSGSHAYSDEGSNAVQVILEDDAPGTATATDTSTATVTEGDTLTAQATTFTISATEGTTFSGTALATFTTTYTANVPTDFTATINWGDGSSSTGSVTGTPGTLTVGGSHLYTDETVGPASIILNDDSPGTATATATGTASVAEADALAAAGAATFTATEGTTFTGTVATFTDSGYSANPTTDFTATIFWGDGATTTGSISGSAGTLSVSGSHLYADEAANPVTVTLADDSPGTVTATATGTATVVEGDTLAAAGTATFTATEGTTFTGTVATFTNTGYPTNPVTDFAATITWGDGMTTAGSVSGSSGTLTVSGSHLYADEGSNPITVTLIDDSPGTATATATGTAIVTEADTLAPTGPVTLSATEGTTFTGAVATFTDTGYSTNAPTDFTATIDWGDGTTTAGTVSGSTGTLTVSGSHLYADEAANSITVILADDSPGTATATATGTPAVAEADTLTAASTATLSATEGATFTGAVATFTDTGYPNNTPSDFTATINWGDGTTTAGTISGSAGTFTVSGSHAYAEEGTQAATVILPDDAPGTAVATATATVAVADATLSAAGTAVAATAGTAFTAVVATFTDANPGATVSDFTATIDWGDGATSAGTVAATGSGFNVTGTHTYATAGTDTITVHIVDVGGSTANATSTATASGSTSAVLSITKAAPTTGQIGMPLVYIITIINTGGAATGTMLTDNLPAGLTFVSATDSLGGTVMHFGGSLSEDIGDLAAGATDTITVTVTATSSVGQTVTNTASVSAANFNGGVAITASATTTFGGTSIGTHICFAAGVPGDGTIQTFINNLYRELLGRDPDSSGNGFWNTYLTEHNNPDGRVQTIQAFMNSPEYKSHYVTCVYENLLGRAPDANGLQYWTQKMGDPGTPGENTGSADEKFVVAAFLGSDEFYIKSGNTPQSWIDAVYEDVFGRHADGQGMAFWTNELQIRGAADRDGIMRDLLTQPEAAHLLLDSFYPAAGGTAANPLAAPGTEAGTGSTRLAQLTGGGWENLYLEGAFDSAREGNDGFFAALAGGGNWDDIQLLLLTTDQYYTNPNRPVTV